MTESDTMSVKFLKFKALKGFKDFGYPMSEAYLTRMDYELGIIDKTGFVPYFFLVADLCRFMREKNIMFRARGSGCGSVVIWGLGISHRWIDPVKYDIPFERFLNPDRVSNPDIDLDIQDDRRHEVVKYTVEKYGADRVARIVTFGALAAKSAVIDIGRALAIPDYQKVTAEISTGIPGGKGEDGKNHRLEDLLKTSEFLREKQQQFPELFKYAIKADGKIRQAGIHAAGTIVAPGPLTDYLPLLYQGNPESRTPDDWFASTQWDMYDCEDFGLVKMDYLGLKTLRVMDQCQKMVNALREMKSEGKPFERFDIDFVDQKDDKTWKLLSEGRLLGVFQVERQFVQRFATRMNLYALKDPWQLAVLVAIIRPGMMDAGMTEVYLRRASGQEVPVPLHPRLEELLKKTYGTLVFQEQVMAVAEVLAGYSKAQADGLRRCIGKKKVDELIKERPKFIEACVKRDVVKEEAEAVCEQIETHGRYSFNLSHSAVYGSVIAYQTAYLKANETLCYMNALINSEAGVSDKEIGYGYKVAEYVEESRAMGLKILPPCVLRSSRWCTIVPPFTNEIRFGLLLIKRVSSGAVNWITSNPDCRQARTLKQFLLSLYERRQVPMMRKEPDGTSVETGKTEWRSYSQVGKSDLEGLLAAGALDCFDNHRPRMKLHIPLLISLVEKYHAQKCKKDNGSKRQKITPEAVMDEINRWSMAEDDYPEETLEDVLRAEREVTGCYLSDSPFAPFADPIRQYCTCTITDVRDGTAPSGIAWHFPAVLGDCREMVIKNGKNKGRPMAFMTFRGIGGDIEGPAFSSTWEQLATKPGLVERGAVYIVHVKQDFKGVGVIVENLWRLSKPSAAK